ncbi:MAG: bifunctional nuclease family protein [Acidimicrobiia bacterium]|nr:bifunctional nuclease family protein [Acidimicrobiia bacterium]
MAEHVPVELVGVRIQLPSQTPIILLKEQVGGRHVPIWIGAVEASAIAYALEGVVPERPLTHDLMRDVVESSGASVERVVVTEMRDQVFFADLVLMAGGGEVHVSARPSDAIALAVRTDAPIFVATSVLEDAGIELKDDDDPEDEIERFREFLEDLTPEDFEG